MNFREWALPIYTILIQLATGALFVLWTIRAAGIKRYGEETLDRVVKYPILILFLTVLTGIIGAHFHLSQPFISILAVTNLRSSWLSREVLFTVLFFVTVGCLTALQWLWPGHARLKTFLGWLAVVIGNASILCMSMIYLLPTQPVWNSIMTLLSFFASSSLLGIAALFAMLVMDLRFSQVHEGGDQNARVLIIKRPMIAFATITVLTVGLIVALNAYQIVLLGNGDNLARISLELLLGLYRPLFIARLILLFAGAAWLIATVVLVLRRGKPITELIGHVYLSFLLMLIGEILGRFLFYAMHVRLGL